MLLLWRKKEKIVNKKEGVLKNLFCANSRCRKLLAKTGSYLGISAVFVALIILIFCLKPITSSLCEREFSFLNLASAAPGKSACSSNLFAEPAKNFLKEPFETCLIQENSLLAVSSPGIITAKTLGDIDSENLDTPRDGIIDYEVGPDDSISSIAEKFNISVDTILWSNNLTSKSAIKPGQILNILPVSGVVHLVKEGDTLGAIAKSYKADVKEIIAFNELKSEQDIFIGDVLIIPNGKIIPKAVAPKVYQIPLADSYFIIPVEGRITQGLHGPLANAIDIANSCGKPIVAAAGGKVQRTGWMSIGGNAVIILHSNGVATYYGHMSQISVAPGQTVVSGQIIGYIGRTGYATGCHVHFEVRGASNFMARYGVGSTVSWKK